jgi:hypothetical protein
MDPTLIYRDFIKQTLLRYAQFRPSHGDIRLDVVFDDVRDRYALMQIGWDRGRRISGDLVYIILQEGKVYIEYDGIEHGIVDDLLARGVRSEDCILAYLPEPTPASIS